MNRKSFIPFHLIFVALLALLALPLSSASANEETRNYTILLHSRAFEPAQGLDPAIGFPLGRWHGLLQLERLPDPAIHAALELHGVELLSYLPNLTWIASLPADYAPLADVSGVRWIGALTPADKVAPALHDPTFVDDLVSESGRIQLWLRLFDDADWEAATQRLGHAGAVLIAEDIRTREITLSAYPADLWSLAADDAVAWILNARTDQSTLNYESRLVANATQVQAPPLNLSGSGIQVGVWDGGLVDGHSDFGDRLTTVGTYAVATHATHVAGTLAGDGSGGPAAGATAETYRGYADGAHIFSYYWSSPTAAHNQAINQYGIDVSQNSWGYTSCSIFGQYSVYASDYDNIIGGQYGRGIPVVFAAGNSNGSCGVTYGSILGGPASAKNVISVGATNEQASDVAGNSSRGPTVDGRIKPEIVAVGQQVQSTCNGDTYCGYSGTSMAAPAVSGSIAFLAEQYANACPINSSPWETALPALYRALLIHTAQDMNDPAKVHLNPGPDYSSGYGRLDAAAAANLLPNHATGTLSSGQQSEYTLTLAGVEDLKVTLAWDDVPAAYAAAVAIINDLDLEIEGPDGTVYGPWRLDPTNPEMAATRPTWSSASPGEPDTRNVVEQVAIDNAQPGTYTVRVRGTAIPQGPQSFALVSKQLSQADRDCQGGTPSAVGVNGELDGSDVLLSWAHAATNDAYEIWSHDTWAFDVNQGQGTLLATVDASTSADGAPLTYRHPGAVGAAPNDIYYAIRARRGGLSSDLSNIIGKLDTRLVAGANNWVTLYFDQGVANAAALMNDIENHSNVSLQVNNVERYLNVAASFQLYALNPFELGNFATTTGGSYRVAVTFEGPATGAIYTQVGRVPAHGLPSTQNAPQTTANVNYHYGQLTGTPDDTRYVAWLGNSATPAELLTDDAFNASEGTGKGFESDYWMINLSNFSTAPADGVGLHVRFGDGSTMWRYDTTVSSPSNHGTVGESSSSAAPIINNVVDGGNFNLVRWAGAPGTYLIYRSQTSSGLNNNASNGRFAYLGMVDTTTAPAEYVDNTPLTGWYIVVPATSDGFINGYPSFEESSYSSPTAITLGGLSTAATIGDGMILLISALLLVSAALLIGASYYHRLQQV